jgi:hypothetical protein
MDKDGKTRRVPDAPAKPAEAGSPGAKPADDKNKPAENPPKGA